MSFHGKFTTIFAKERPGPINDPKIRDGVSSFRVLDGTWSLLDKDGGNIVVQGMTQFGRGVCLNMPYPSDKVSFITNV